MTLQQKYNPAVIEPKWQEFWEKEGSFRTSEDRTKPKFYALIEFPYPSGEGLHVGHPRPYTALDIVSRKRRMEGYNVLFPMGWDAFGLPTEATPSKTRFIPASSQSGISPASSSSSDHSAFPLIGPGK